MRIQLGRRIVFGQMANGQFRNELDADRLKTIFDALQRPAAEGIDPDKYKGKIPAIEIRDGNNILFREEGDGIVTVNQIEFQLQRQNQSEGNISDINTSQDQETLQESSQPKLQKPKIDLNEHHQQVRQAQELRVLSLAVLDLQGVVTPLGDRQYQSEHFIIHENAKDGTLTIASEESTILRTTREGQILVTAPREIPVALTEINEAYNRAEELQWQIESNELPPDDLSLDWQAQNIQSQDIANTATFLLNPLGDNHPLYGTVAIEDYQISQNADGLVVTRGNDELVLIVREGQVWDYGATTLDWETFQQFQPQRSVGVDQDSQTATIQDQVDLTADITPLMVDGEDRLPAIAVAQREAVKLPDGGTKQLIQTTHQDWKQQILHGLGQGLRETTNWLASRPETMRDQSIARSSLELFNRGYVRTGEKTYEVENFKISLQGTNTYSLSDDTGELMRFKATKSPMPGLDRPSVQILSKSDRLSSSHQATFQQMRQNRSLIPLGDLDAEASYGAKTQRVEKTVRLFLKSQKATAWDKENGWFKFETGAGNVLSITDKKEGRGEVYRRERGRVTSSLGANDFAHFERLAAQLQSSDLQQPQQSSIAQNQSRSSRKQSSGMELS
ncbi:hypothetical protein [Phormidesmis priestleyi]